MKESFHIFLRPVRITARVLSVSVLSAATLAVGSLQGCQHSTAPASDTSSALATRPELIFPGAVDVTEEPIVARVLSVLRSQQKVFVFGNNKPEAWSAVNKTYLTSTLLSDIQSASALCFVIGHELAHLQLHEFSAESHDSIKVELEADNFAVQHCVKGGYSGAEAVSFVQQLLSSSSAPAQKKVAEKRLQAIGEYVQSFAYQPYEPVSPELQQLKNKLLYYVRE